MPADFKWVDCGSCGTTGQVEEWDEEKQEYKLVTCSSCGGAGGWDDGDDDRKDD